MRLPVIGSLSFGRRYELKTIAVRAVGTIAGLAIYNYGLGGIGGINPYLMLMEQEQQAQQLALMEQMQR